MSFKIKSSAIIILVCVSYICGLKVTFERAYMTYWNPKYVGFAYVNVTRYSRKSDYYANIEYDSIYSTTNNVTIHIYFYELLRNQYKRSFIEFHHKICDFLMHDPYIGAVAAHFGLNTCPVRSGVHKLLNITAKYEKFPNVFPFEKGRVDFLFNATATWEPVAAATAYITFKNELRGRNRS